MNKISHDSEIPAHGQRVTILNMGQINITEKEKISGGWVFGVRIEEGGGSTIHTVTVPEGYYKKLTRSTSSGQAGMPPDELLRKSFEFLLAREPKESILREFELPAIQKYFPEYEKEIKCRDVMRD